MKELVDSSLRKYVEREIVPRYLAFDRAHGIDHVRTVIDESLALAVHYEVNMDMVYTVAAYHDTGLVGGRDAHHIVSGEILAGDVDLRRWFTDKQLQTMREAVEDHRASAGREPRSIYGKIVSEADRIISPATTLLRTVQYGIEHHPELNEQEQYRRFKLHIEKKYGEDGYVRLWIPYSSNKEKLAELRALIRDEKALHDRFLFYYYNKG